MRRGPWLARPLIGAILTLLVGCSAAPVPGPSLPTFPASDDGSASAAAVDRARTPASSRTTARGSSPSTSSSPCSGCRSTASSCAPRVGVPAPSVGRLERMDCAYTGTAPAGPDSGKRVLAINAAAYTSPDAAHAQWVLNTVRRGRRAPRPAGRQRRRGARRAAGGDAAGRPLRLGHRTLVLPDQPLPAASTAAGMLVDLARRVLPTRAAPPHQHAPHPAAASHRRPHAGRDARAATRAPRHARAPRRLIHAGSRGRDVLRVGLTGGIGSGKSTVAARLVERGAVLVDSDRLAREVVAPGTAGLAAVVDAFGDRRARRRRQLGPPGARRRGVRRPRGARDGSTASSTRSCGGVPPS